MQGNQEFRRYLEKSIEELNTMESESNEVRDYISLFTRIFEEILSIYNQTES